MSEPTSADEPVNGSEPSRLDPTDGAQTEYADFDIDLGTDSYKSATEDDVDIDLNFDSGPAPAEDGDDINLDFGDLTKPEEPAPAEEDDEDE